MLNNVQDLLTVFDIGNPDYEVLEYIELDGTQYFDTGYYGTLNTKLEAGISFTNLDTHMMVFGARNGGATGTSNVSCLAAFGYASASEKLLAVDFNNESALSNYRLQISPSNLIINTFYDITTCRDFRSVSLDGSYVTPKSGNTNPQTTNATTAFDSQYTITIGTVNGAIFGGTTYYNFSGRVRYFRIIENGVLVHDYVPALDKNGKPCLYDRKNQNAIYAYKVSDGTDATDTLQYKRWINKQEVEYIESTGTQYIDTGVLPSADLLTDVDFSTTNDFAFSTASCLLGSYTRSGSNYTLYSVAVASATELRFPSGNQFTNLTIPTIGTSRHNLKYAQGNQEFDGTQIGTLIGQQVVTTGVPTIRLFGRSSNDGTDYITGNIRVYNLTMWQGTQVIRDLQPVVYQGVACLYDKVYNKIYTNAGTGAFKHGPFTKEDTNKYEVLKYITGDGTQFFETDYFATDSSEYQYRAMCYNDVSGARQVFGVITDNHTASVTGYLFNGTNARWADKTVNNTTATANAWHDCILNKSGYTVDGVKTSFTNATITGTSERPVSIIGITPVSGLPSSGGQIHLSCFKIFENGVLVRDYIPVLDETFTPCLYDRANRVFLYHTNTEGSTTIPSYEAWNKKNVYYIESTGTQYIDTGFYPNQDTKAELVFKVETDLATGFPLFGARESVSARGFSFQRMGTGYWGGMYGGTVASSTTSADIKKHTVFRDKNKIYLDGDLILTQNVVTFASPVSMVLNAMNTNGTVAIQNCSVRYYRFKLWDNNILIRDYQPVVVQGTACMYDSAYNKVYTNAGTGVFIAGPDIDKPDERYEVLEYIQLDGTQYFDTGFITSDVTDNIVFNGRFEGIATSAASQIFGAVHSSGGGWFGIPKGTSVYGLGNTSSSERTSIAYNTDSLFYCKIERKNASGSSWSATLDVDGSTATRAYNAVSGQVNTFHILIGASCNTSANDVSFGSQVKIKCLKLYIDNVFVRDYIPVLDSDGLPCLYDRVTKTFLYAKKISDGTDASATLGYSRWNKYDVDYIESTGTQYIDTGYKPTKSLSFDLYGIDMNYSSGTTRFGSRTGTYSETFVLATIADSHFRWSYGTGAAPATTDNVFSTEKTAKQISWNATTKKCTITFTDGTTEDSVQMKGTDLTSSAIPIYLFAFNSVGEPICGTVKHTRIVFREGGTLIRDFKPVVWNSSSGTQACLYDEVYNKMYTNAGIGAFKASIISKVNGTLADIEVGASLTPVRTSATVPNPACPYIMTDIIPNDSVGCEFIFSVTGNDKGNYVIASRGDNTGRFYLYSNEGSTNIKYGWGTFETTSTATTINHKYVMSLNKFMDKKFIADGTKLADLPPVDFSGNTSALCLLANNTNGTVACSELTGLHGNLYYGIITLFNKVIREYIPARYNSTVGIFERKTGKFLTNDSTVGSFTFNDFS